MVVVDDLDKRLDLGAAVDQLLTHAAGNLLGVALDTGNDGEGEGVSLGARVLRLDNDDLNKAMSVMVILPSRRSMSRIAILISPDFVRFFDRPNHQFCLSCWLVTDTQSRLPPLANRYRSFFLAAFLPSLILRGERIDRPSYRRSGLG